jgi:hypothetical protein
VKKQVLHGSNLSGTYRCSFTEQSTTQPPKPPRADLATFINFTSSTTHLPNQDLCTISHRFPKPITRSPNHTTSAPSTTSLNHIQPHNLHNLHTPTRPPPHPYNLPAMSDPPIDYDGLAARLADTLQSIDVSSLQQWGDTDSTTKDTDPATDYAILETLNEISTHPGDGRGFDVWSSTTEERDILARRYGADVDGSDHEEEPVVEDSVDEEPVDEDAVDV